MERKEAISELKWIKKINQEILNTDAKELDINCAWVKHWENVIEALEMAISSLDTDEAYQLEYERTTKNDLGVDCISRADALRVAKNEYLRGWHNALCKALSEKYSIHCEEGNFSVIQEETITGLGLSMDCALGKDVESYMSTIPSVTPQEPKTGYWIEHPTEEDYSVCSRCGIGSRRMEHGKNADGTKYIDIYSYRFCPYCGAKMEEPQESEDNKYTKEQNNDI